MASLADLLKAKTVDEREAQLLAMLNLAGFPVTDYFVGSAGRTELKMVVTGLKDFDDLVPQIASGGFMGPFTVGDKTYPTSEWLDILASEIFSLTRSPATNAKQRIKAWNLPGAGPYTIVAGQLTARSQFGDLYTNVTGVTVPSGIDPPINKVTIDFQAESPGSIFNRDIAGTIIELVTPLPGLVIANEPLSFGSIDSAGRALRYGSGTGTVTPSETAPGTAPTPARTFTITITLAGQVGAGVASMLVDDGSNQTTVPLSPIPASYGAGGGVSIAFANGGQSPSFLVGDVYTFTTPGSPIINPGSDAESDASLIARMRGRWPELAEVPLEDRYVSWIRRASIDNGYGITKVTSQASVTFAGQADIRVATALGAVPGGVVAALQAYVDARDGIMDKANIQSAVNLAVSAGGTVTVRSAAAAATKLQAKTNWESYIAALGIGGDSPEGVVRLAELEQAIMDAGAVDVSGLTLNAVAANLALTITQVATAGNSIDTALTWVEVP